MAHLVTQICEDYSWTQGNNHELDPSLPCLNAMRRKIRVIKVSPDRLSFLLLPQSPGFLNSQQALDDQLFVRLIEIAYHLP